MRGLYFTRLHVSIVWPSCLTCTYSSFFPSALLLFLLPFCLCLRSKWQFGLSNFSWRRSWYSSEIASVPSSNKWLFFCKAVPSQGGSESLDCSSLWTVFQGEMVSMRYYLHVRVDKNGYLSIWQSENCSSLWFDSDCEWGEVFMLCTVLVKQWSKCWTGESSGFQGIVLHAAAWARGG